MKDILSESVIHASIVIGACGHRKLDNEPVISRRIQEAVRLAIEMVPPMKNTPLDIDVLSPLAEGADRLVAREVLKVSGAKLTAILPLEEADYMDDFKTCESQKEFVGMLKQANDVIVLQPQGSRVDAYEKAGHYTVDHCDVLIVIWDGQAGAGKGGTEQIVQYARKNKRPLLWIQADAEAKLTIDPGNGINAALFNNIEKYNAERIRPFDLEKRFEKEYNFFVSKAELSGVPLLALESAFIYLLCYYVRADTLASHYQHLHFGVDSMVTVLALAAVITAAFQIIFLPEFPSILILEVLLMMIVLGMVALSRRRGWHRKWMDYRYLAERLRSALFMSLTDIEVLTQQHSRRGKTVDSPREWILCSFLSIWRQRPRSNPGFSLPYEALNKFVRIAWIEDQVQYHTRAGKKHDLRHHRMSATGYILFALTVCAALLHIAHFKSHLLEASLAFAAIVFPAVAASITAIRIQRDYRRKSLRSLEMARRLSEIESEVILATDYDEFLDLLKEIDEMMLVESEDWRDLVWLHKPEIPV